MKPTGELVSKLKDGFEAKKKQLETHASELDMKISDCDELTSSIEAEKKASEEKGFEEGLKQADQAGGDDKIYSDAEMNQFIAEAKAPLEAEIVVLKEDAVGRDALISQMETSIETMQAEIAGVPAKVEAAVAEFKAAMKAEYEKQQVAETEGETGFAKLFE